MAEIGFDVISDLNLKPNDSFNWEGKSTSLYLILSGNISSDLRTISQTLFHLAKFYQGIFYTPGTLEYAGIENVNARTAELLNICQRISQVALLHHNLIIIDGVAVIGSNCWENASTHKKSESISIMDLQFTQHRLDDMGYLHQCLTKIQRHPDVKKIIIVTNAVPNINCYFGENPIHLGDSDIPLDTVLNADTEGKVSHWVYGSYSKVVEATLLLPRTNDLICVTNPKPDKGVYWAKHITVKL